MRAVPFVVVVLLGLVLIAFSSGFSNCVFAQNQTSDGSRLTAWVSSAWVQTSQADFEAGVRVNVDTATSPGDVTLVNAGNESFPSYSGPGTIASQVLDTGSAGSRWDALAWNATLPDGTHVTFEVRASGMPFSEGDPWSDAGGTTPVYSGLADGRYMQWRATLDTSDENPTALVLFS